MNEIIQSEQDEFHLFSDHRETMNIDINVHLEDDVDGNVNVVLYQTMKNGDDYGFVATDDDIIGFIRVPYSLIMRTLNPLSGKIIYHRGTGTYFSLDDDVLLIDADEAGEKIYADLMDSEGDEIAVYWGKRIKEVITEEDN